MTALRDAPPPQAAADAATEAEGVVASSRTEALAAAEAAAKATFEITFSKSDRTIAWDDSFDSLLEFAEEHGIDMDSGCRAGNCGTCLTAVKSGEVHYATDPGAEPEEGSCLTCVCVPKGPLDLDA